MQIHMKSERPNDLDMIVRNILAVEQGFPVDLIDNSFDSLGDETGLAPLRSGGLGGEWERRIWNGHRDGCSRLPRKN